ncbi:MAG: hypothetical protein ACYCY7_13490, partial [Gallionella sp.]
RQVRRLVWESAPGYALHRFPNKIEKADNSCATEPDNSKNPRQCQNNRIIIRRNICALGN